jgi:aminopeptidase-like protein
VGDAGSLQYKRSRQGNAEIDRAVIKAQRVRGKDLQVRDFSPYGYDERQYCSPGFNLPVGSLTRSPHGTFPQYHTSADNLDFVRPEALADSLAAYLAVVRILEGNACYQNVNPCCEPQLGKRGLYRSIGGLPDAGRMELALLWVLNLSDSTHSLLDIAERADLPFELVQQAAETLVAHNLLEERLP